MGYCKEVFNNKLDCCLTNQDVGIEFSKTLTPRLKQLK